MITDMDNTKCINNKSSTTISIIIAEWRIWSKCFGKVIGINGPTSVGKSTLAKQIAEELGYHLISVDDILNDIVCTKIFTKWTNELSDLQLILTTQDWLDILQGRKFKEEKYSQEALGLFEVISKDFTYFSSEAPNESSVEMFNLIYAKAKTYIFSNENVVIELSIKNTVELEMLCSSFNSYPILLSLVYSSLEDNLSRCFARNKPDHDLPNCRFPSDVVKDYEIFYKIHTMPNISKNDKLYVIDKNKTIPSLKEAKKHEDSLNDFIITSTNLKKNDSGQNIINCLIEKLEKTQLMYYEPSLTYHYIVNDNSNFIMYLKSGYYEVVEIGRQSEIEFSLIF